MNADIRITSIGAISEGSRVGPTLEWSAALKAGGCKPWPPGSVVEIWISGATPSIWTVVCYQPDDGSRVRSCDPDCLELRP